ncbi:MAG: hypothetical protein IPM33_08645 [Phycisphaerales bacterium]|nr:hypothetical protein [Phycisphaerales bacterium]
MSNARVVSLTAVSILAILWAGVMSLLGLIVLADGPGALPVPDALFSFLGLGAVSGGQFVFMVLVADRLFPAASRRMAVLAEGVALALFVLGIGASVYVFHAGGTL